MSTETKKLVKALHEGDGEAYVNNTPINRTDLCSAIAELKKIETDKVFGDYSVREEQIDAKLKTKIVRLIGQKPMVNCYLDGKNCRVLWDTGAMASLVDTKWVAQNFPDKELYSVDEFLEGSTLQVKAANATIIPYSGVLVLDLSLSRKGPGFGVPFLVTSQDMSEPILGFNVIEHIASDEGLKGQLSSALINTCPEQVASVVSLINDKSMSSDVLDTVKIPYNVTIPAGGVRLLKCKIKVLMNNSQQTINFIPRTNEDDDRCT